MWNKLKVWRLSVLSGDSLEWTVELLTYEQIKFPRKRADWTRLDLNCALYS